MSRLAGKFLYVPSFIHKETKAYSSILIHKIETIASILNV